MVNAQLPIISLGITYQNKRRPKSRLLYNQSLHFNSNLLEAQGCTQFGNWIPAKVIRTNLSF